MQLQNSTHTPWKPQSNNKLILTQGQGLINASQQGKPALSCELLGQIIVACVVGVLGSSLIIYALNN